MTPSLDNLLLVMAVAFAAPLVLGLFPRLQLPSVVLEIVAGIVIGPSVLGWAEVDQAVQVVALIGLAFVLFLAGLEIEFDEAPRAAAAADRRGLRAVVRDRARRVAAAERGRPRGHAAAGRDHPVRDVAGRAGAGAQGRRRDHARRFGQLIIAAASIADFGAIILLSLFFSGEGGTGSTLLLLGSLFALAAVVLVVVRGAEHSMRIRDDLLRLQDTTAQIRVRAALVLFVGFAAVADALGLEVILGAFIAGAIVSLADRDQAMTHPDFRRKLEAIGFGFFIPVFFVSSGVRFDLDALTSSTSSVVMVPVFLAALVVVRGLPAALYRRRLGPRKAAIAGLMQATSLPFIVAATAIGLELGLIDAAGSAALIGAGLLSVLCFPLAGLILLRRDGAAREPDVEPAPMLAM